MTDERQNADPVRAGDDMAEALKHLWSGLIAIKPLLDKAYPDDPRWTPWSRFVEHELNLAMTARETWQAGRTSGCLCQFGVARTGQPTALIQKNCPEHSDGKVRPPDT